MLEKKFQVARGGIDNRRTKDGFRAINFEDRIGRRGKTRNKKCGERRDRASFNELRSDWESGSFPSPSVKLSQVYREFIGTNRRKRDNALKMRTVPKDIYALFDYRNYLFQPMNTFLVENRKPSNWNIWKRDQSCSNNSSFFGSKVRFSLFWILCGIIIKPFLSSLCFLYIVLYSIFNIDYSRIKRYFRKEYIMH